MDSKKLIKKLLLCCLSVVAFISCDKSNELLEKVNNKEKIDSLFYIFNDTMGMDMITNNIDRIYYIAKDSLTGGKIIEGSKIDTNVYKWIKDESFVVYVDSNNRITSLMMDDFLCSFYNYTESTVDVSFIDGNGNYECVEELPYESFFSSKGRTKSEAGVDFIEGTLNVVGGVKSSLELALNISKNPLCLKTAFSSFDYLSNFLPNEIKVVGAGASMGLQKRIINIRPDVFSLFMILIEGGHAITDNLTELLIGNWDLDIIGVKHINSKNAEITFMVSGVKDNPSVKLSGNVYYINNDNRNANNIPFQVYNNIYTISLPLSSSGNYSGFVSINGQFGFFKQKGFNFKVFDIGLDRYVIGDDIKYKDGKVCFKLDVYLKGDIESLNRSSEVGYYISYANKIDYYKVNNSSPNTLNLELEYDDFDEKDYSSYIAKANEFKIGVYVAYDHNRKIIYYDDQTINGLIYKKEPKLIFVNPTMDNLEVGEYDEENDITHYKAYFSFTIDIEGVFWFNTIQYVIASDDWNNNWEEQTMTEDGQFGMNGWLTYDSNSTVAHTAYYSINLKNGSSKRSTNTLDFGGEPSNPYVNLLSGGKANVRAISKNQIGKSSHNTSSFKSISISK